MTDLLSIATYTADQILADEDRTGNLTLVVDFASTDYGWMVQIVSIERIPTMSRTSTIIAEMRAADAAHAAKNAERPPTARRERYPLATTTGRSDAYTIAQTLLMACPEDRALTAFNGITRNNVRHEYSLPRRAMSMAASRGRVRPDSLASLMAFFSNPADMAETMLASFLPMKVSTAQATALLSDPFVVDVIEGLGMQVPAPKDAVKAVKNWTARGHGGAGRVYIYKPGAPLTVDPKRRGRPAGPKYVAHLPFASTAQAAALLLTGPRPMMGCVDISGVPGGNDVAHGAGHDQGAGWDKAWAEGKSLSPAQVRARDIALDAYHDAEAKRYAASLADEG